MIFLSGRELLHYSSRFILEMAAFGNMQFYMLFPMVASATSNDHLYVQMRAPLRNSLQMMCTV